ncbi:MAG: VacJ family lipoprotein [Hyphomonadaceae bacterium]|nr:VacJ family lipoprotein [Hyphomonadaceae bacterium]
MSHRAALLAAACLLACGATPALAQETLADPWEGTNRQLFALHEGIDQAVLEPAARGYRAATPGFFRTGVTNFLRNLRGPVVLANDLLQGELPRAGTTAARFGINTTIGLGGLVDVADRFGFEHHDEDFGQTLAVWGVEPGPYVFVPVLGPSTVRDSFGRVIDTALSPLTWAEFDGETEFGATRGVLTGLSARESLLETIDGVRASSFDPYVDFRVGYALTRAAAIQNGRDDGQDSTNFNPSVDDEISAISQGMEEPAAPAAEPTTTEPPQN